MLKETWRKFSLLEQMANIGSEVSRFVYWKERGEEKEAENSFYRALELIDLTLSDKRWRRNIALREVGLLREILADYFLGLSSFNLSSESLKNYFLPFALAISNDQQQE